MGGISTSTGACNLWPDESQLGLLSESFCVFDALPALHFTADAVTSHDLSDFCAVSHTKGKWLLSALKCYHSKKYLYINW